LSNGARNRGAKAKLTVKLHEPRLTKRHQLVRQSHHYAKHVWRGEAPESQTPQKPRLRDIFEQQKRGRIKRADT
jgi:hypothetical protein